MPSQRGSGLAIKCPFPWKNPSSACKTQPHHLPLTSKDTLEARSNHWCDRGARLGSCPHATPRPREPERSPSGQAHRTSSPIPPFIRGSINGLALPPCWYLHPAAPGSPKAGKSQAPSLLLKNKKQLLRSQSEVSGAAGGSFSTVYPFT